MANNGDRAHSWKQSSDPPHASHPAIDSKWERRDALLWRPDPSVRETTGLVKASRSRNRIYTTKMPPRKSDARKSDVSAVAAAAATATTGDASQITAGDDSVLSTTTTTQGGAGRSISEGASSAPKKGKEIAAAATAAGDNDKTTIEDLTLPKSIITRLAKGVLPANTQIQANAIMAMSKSTTVFISYLAAQYVFFYT